MRYVLQIYIYIYIFFPHLLLLWCICSWYIYQNTGELDNYEQLIEMFFVSFISMTYSTRLVRSISLVRFGSFPLFFYSSSSNCFFPVSSPKKLASLKMCSSALSFFLCLARAHRSFQLNFFFSHTRATWYECTLSALVASHEDRYCTDGNNAALRWWRSSYLPDDWSHRRADPLELPRTLLRGLVRRQGKTVSEEKEIGKGGYSITPSVWSQGAFGMSGIDSLQGPFRSLSLSFSLIAIASDRTAPCLRVFKSTAYPLRTCVRQ